MYSVNHDKSSLLFIAKALPSNRDKLPFCTIYYAPLLSLKLGMTINPTLTTLFIG